MTCRLISFQVVFCIVIAMGDWYECKGSGRNATGASLTLFGEKGYLIGGTASNLKRKKEKGCVIKQDPADSPWLQIDHVQLPTVSWKPVIVNSGGLLNRAYHASAGMSTLDNRVFVFGGIYTSCPDEIATDVLEIETSSIFGVQATLCEAASSHPASALRGLSCSTIGKEGSSQKIVLFGGSRNAQSQGDCSNDLYLFHPEFASSSWQGAPILDEEGRDTGERESRPDCFVKLEPAEDAYGNINQPCARVHHTCVTAGPNKDYLLLFGGQAEDGTLLNDVWLANLSECTNSFTPQEAVSGGEGEEGEEGEGESEERVVAAVVIWTKLSDGSDIVSPRFLHSSYAIMKPIVEGCDIDPCLYLSVYGGCTQSGYASANEVFTACINLEPEVTEPDEDGNGGCDGQPCISEFSKNPHSLNTGASSNMHMAGAAVGLLTTPDVPVALVMTFNGNHGALTITNDGVSLALFTKKDRIRVAKEAKAAAALAGQSSVVEEPEDPSGMPSKVTYSNGDIYTGDLRLPPSYNEGDPIVPVTLIRSGKGKMIYKATGEVYEGAWVDGVRSGFGTSETADEEGRLTRHEGQYSNDARNGPGVLRLIPEMLNEDSVNSGCEESKAGNVLSRQASMNEPGNSNSNLDVSKATYYTEEELAQLDDPLLIFDGNWVGGLMDGDGILRYANGDVYKGQFSAGKRHGKGTLTPARNNDSLEYTGDWSNDKIAGEGEVKSFPIEACETAPAGIYEGNTFNGVPYGPGGYCAYTDGSEYLGEWRRGRRNGYGKFISASMDTYEGKFVGNVRSGYGTLTYKSGEKLEGLWKNNKANGPGKRTFPNGDVEEGTYVDGELR